VRRRALVAGLAGSVVSAFPSTLWTLIRRGDVLEGGRALGLVLLPNQRRTVVLLVAGAPVHLALSVGWAYVLAAVLPPRGAPRRFFLSPSAAAAMSAARVTSSITETGAASP